MCDKLLKPRQSFWITLYIYVNNTYTFCYALNYRAMRHPFQANVWPTKYLVLKPLMCSQSTNRRYCSVPTTHINNTSTFYDRLLYLEINGFQKQRVPAAIASRNNVLFIEGVTA